jgi:hypothetical protein
MLRGGMELRICRGCASNNAKARNCFGETNADQPNVYLIRMWPFGHTPSKCALLECIAQSCRSWLYRPIHAAGATIPHLTAGLRSILASAAAAAEELMDY